MGEGGEGRLLALPEAAAIDISLVLAGEAEADWVLVFSMAFSALLLLAFLSSQLFFPPLLLLPSSFSERDT